MRVVIPNKLQGRVLEELRDGHLGVVKLKALATRYVWCPYISGHLEKLVTACSGCQLNQRMPTKALLYSWEWATTPWQRIHIDFTGPFQSSMFLVVGDARSKWSEMLSVSSITSGTTIDVLRDSPDFEISEHSVSDNGSQFVSEELHAFARSNGIRHITSGYKGSS